MDWSSSPRDMDSRRPGPGVWRASETDFQVQRSWSNSPVSDGHGESWLSQPLSLVGVCQAAAAAARLRDAEPRSRSRVMPTTSFLQDKNQIKRMRSRSLSGFEIIPVIVSCVPIRCRHATLGGDLAAPDLLRRYYKESRDRISSNVSCERRSVSVSLLHNKQCLLSRHRELRSALFTRSATDKFQLISNRRSKFRKLPTDGVVTVPRRSIPKCRDQL